MSFLPIDLGFMKKRKKVGKEKGIVIWGPVDPPKKLGIRGTYVAVDWDICTGCGICLETCPKQLYEWVETSGHPTSEKKAFPAREPDCIQCLACETQCPAQAIRISVGAPSSGWQIAVYGFLSQIILGFAYWAFFGSYLSLQILQYAGWIVLAISLPFFFSPVIYFRKKGKSPKEKSLMLTTVIVDSGTYGIVRHPQILGFILLISASILIFQHWLSVIIGVPLMVLFYREAVKEEKGLIIKFGDDYKRYMKKVPRMNFLLGVIRLLRRK